MKQYNCKFLSRIDIVLQLLTNLSAQGTRNRLPSLNYLE